MLDGISIPRMKAKAGCDHVVTLKETPTGVTVKHGEWSKHFKTEGEWVSAIIDWIRHE